MGGERASGAAVSVADSGKRMFGIECVRGVAQLTFAPNGT